MKLISRFSSFFFITLSKSLTPPRRVQSHITFQAFLKASRPFFRSFFCGGKVEAGKWSCLSEGPRQAGNKQIHQERRRSRQPGQTNGGGKRRAGGALRGRSSLMDGGLRPPATPRSRTPPLPPPYVSVTACFLLCAPLPPPSSPHGPRRSVLRCLQCVVPASVRSFARSSKRARSHRG